MGLQTRGEPPTWTAPPAPPPAATFAATSAPAAKSAPTAIHVAPAFSNVHTKQNTSQYAPQTFDSIPVSVLCVKKGARNNLSCDFDRWIFVKVCLHAC